MGLADALQFTVGADTRPFETAMGRVERTSQRAGQVAAVAFRAASAAGAAAALATGAIGKAALSTGAEFERLEVRLSTLLGSAEAGHRRMQDLTTLASSTPFEIAGLVEAEVALESFGANAPEWRQAVMDLSGALGLDLVEAAQAVGRAFAGGAGAADILRERGVLSMVELRSGVKATEMSVAEFREELLATLTDPDGKIAGGTAKLSATFGGLMSNLQDEWTKFALTVSQASLFEGSKAAARELLAIMEENRAQLDALAKGIGEGLTTALQGSIFVLGKVADAVTLVRFGIGGWELAGRQAIAAITAGLADLIEAAEVVNARLGDPLGAADDMAAAWRTVAAASNDAGAAFDATREDMMALATTIGAGSEAAERMISAIQRARDAGPRTIGGAGDSTSGQPTAAIIGGGGGDEQAMTAEIEFLTIREEGLVRIIDLEAERAALLAAQNAELEQQATIYDGLGGILGTVYGIGMSLAGALVDENDRAAKAIFDLFRGVGAAEIVFNTAAGLSRAAAQPPPLNIIMTGQVLAGAALAGIELAKAKPPTAHLGEGVIRAPETMPGEVDRRTRVGESVLNTQATAQLGEAGVNALNRGESMRPLVVAVPMYQHRPMGAVLADHVKLPGNAISTAIQQAAGRVGHSDRAG